MATFCDAIKKNGRLFFTMPERSPEKPGERFGTAGRVRPMV